MKSSNLRETCVNVASTVDLQDSSLLASAWPELEFFMIDLEWDTKGITPGGLVQLLATC